MTMIASLACPSETAANDESSLSPEALWQTCLLPLPKHLSDRKKMVEAGAGKRQTPVCPNKSGLGVDVQAEHKRGQITDSAAEAGQEEPPGFAAG
jgi:hypothetical protein